MFNRTQSFALTPAQWEQAKALLLKQYGITVSGNTGSEQGFGTTVDFAYDGEAHLIVSAHGVFTDQAMSKIQGIIGTVG
jgi:hypothetical protein